MNSLELARKDIVQILRDKRSLIFLIAMPIVFTLFMGFAYRADSQAEDARLPLALVLESETRLSRMLLERLESSDALRVIQQDKAAALLAFQQEQVAGVLIVPAGFGDQAAEASTAQLQLISAANTPHGQALYQLLRISVSQVLSAAQVAQLSAEIQADPTEFTPALELAWSKWSGNTHQGLVRVETASAPRAESWFGSTPYNQASPGILVQFALFGLITSAQVLVQERKNRTLQRLLTTSMRPWEMIAGHLLAMFALVFTQSLLLVVFGQFILGVDYLREPLACLLITTSLSAWAAALGLLIGTLAQGDDQVVLLSMLAMFLFSALGGCWFPLEMTGGSFAALGRLMPSAWAMTGLQNILLRGLGLQATWLPAGILLAYAAGFLTLALWRFRALKV